MVAEQATYKQNCIRMYEKKVERYIHTYAEDYRGYPGNQKRLTIMLDLVRKYNPQRILYVGCGACLPMVKLIEEFECQVVGIDFSGKMIERGKKVLEQFELNPEMAQLGDIEHLHTLPEGLFDFAIAAGVFTHLTGDAVATQNLNRKLKIGGGLALEFRNELFACFSFNRYSYDFFLNNLIADPDLPVALREQVEMFFKENFSIPTDEKILPKSTHMKDDYINRFHNPLNIGQLFDAYGFSWIENYFYHYHILPPQFEKTNPDLYQRLSINRENPSDWRGNLMASAFVGEAQKIGCV